MSLSAENYEKMGVFYLGRGLDRAGSPTTEPVLYPSKDLTTHGLCVGMTGSGKTGLCLGLLEEAAIDQIPVIAIDPKGDLGNLLLTFPNLTASEFAPWVDAAQAEREGISIEALAEREAARTRAGLAEFGQDSARIARLMQSVERVIYTPGSRAGRPLALLRSFCAPTQPAEREPELLRDRVQGIVSSLLSLAGIDADPLRSREHILLSQIFMQAFEASRDLSLPDLIRCVQKPSFTSVGVFELETFYPAKERLELAMSLNNLIAAAGAQALAQGEPLEIAELLRGKSGKPKLSILSIAHLNDGERMAFVTTVLSELIAWMRTQPGTSSLRALLYMDEIFGYFPPTAAPPSKQPMLTLLKQARAFGVGVMLATQNPVDLDYKGLSNCGTWFIGRLQTERDKLRVLDGLEGAAASAGRSFDRSEMDRLLSGLRKRVFLMNNVHETAPRLVETRFTLSYLRGPVTRDEIKRLMPASASAAPSPEVPASDNARSGLPRTEPMSRVAAGEANSVADIADAAAGRSLVALRPEVPEAAHEVFFPAFNRLENVTYTPGLYARAKLHFVDKKLGLDVWQSYERWVPVLATDADPRFSAGSLVPPIFSANIAPAPLPGSQFEPLPPCLQVAKKYAAFRKAFAQYLYESEAYVMWRAPALKLSSEPGETEAQFRARVEIAAREARDEALEDLQEDYREEFEKLQAKLEKAQAKLDRERAQSRDQALDAALSVGTGLLGALLGRKVASQANVRRAGRAGRSGAKAARARVDVAQAEQSRELLEQAIEELEREFHTESARVSAELDPAHIDLEEQRVPPRKADINVETLQLAWRPD